MNKANYMKNEYSLIELWEKNAILTMLILIILQNYKISGDVFPMVLTSFLLIWIMFEWLSSTFREEPPKEGHRFYFSDLIDNKKEGKTLAHGAGCSYEKALNNNNENMKKEVN